MGNDLKRLKRDGTVTKTYDIKEKLGTGSFAVVKRGVRKSDGMEFALKIVKKKNLNQEELSTIHEEVEIMHKIEHANIVSFVEIYDTPKNLYMVLELLTGGELFERIVEKGSYSEKEASELIRDITGAIRYLHSIGIVHRDLKPENLIYKSPDGDAAIKITDFGLAKYVVNNETMKTACGTPGYVAPEILKNEAYDKAVDMWSIGVILYILLCGFPPFYDENAAGLYSQIKRGEFDFPDPYWTNISDDAKDLVTKLLTVDPKKRCSSGKLLRHPWIAENVASDTPLDDNYSKRLMKFNARRKLRRGIQMIMAVNRLKTAFDLDEEKDDE